MKSHKSNGSSYLDIAYVAMALAEADEEKLEVIALDLEAGRNDLALEGMREYVSCYRKQPDREQTVDYDRESKRKTRA